MCVDRCVIGTNQRKNQVGHYSSQTGTESTQPVYITHHFKVQELSTGFVACSVSSAYEKNFMNQLISRHFYDNINDNKQQVFHWDNRCKEWILFLPYKWPVLTHSVKSRPLCFPDYFISLAAAPVIPRWRNGNPFFVPKNLSRLSQKVRTPWASCIHELLSPNSLVPGFYREASPDVTEDQVNYSTLLPASLMSPCPGRAWTVAPRMLRRWAAERWRKMNA